MLKLNLKIALRNMMMHKTSSVINIIGLAIGLASCLMLILFVAYEWNFDKQFKGAENVYQVITNFKDTEGKISGGREPLAYYLMSGWLNNFEFRTTISSWIILITLCGTLIIALLTVSYQACKNCYR